MPSAYNLPRPQGNWDQQNIDQYNKLPFYLANLAAQMFPMYTRWDKLVGTKPWEPNMGNVMKGVRAEPTPIGRAIFVPNDITNMPLKDVFTVLETTETARLKRHNFESQQINFNPSFADFRKNQIPFAMKDISQQVAQANDIFIRTNIWSKSPQVFISGKATISDNASGFYGDELVAAPIGDVNNAGTAATSKTTAWLQQATAYIGDAGDVGALSYKVIRKVKTILCEDLMAPAFEGMANTPKDNETIKGKWVLVCGNEAFEALSFDNYILANKPAMMNLINDEFSGVIGSHVAAMLERFPMRVLADGTIPAPQTYEANPDAWNYGMTIANPAYISAPFEIAFMLGAKPYESLKIGPPPKEFASGSMDGNKFNRLQWNGEVRITDNVLLQIAQGVYDTNKYGEFVQLICDLTMGIIPVQRRYVVPILFRRRRVRTN